jgi:hypothetical protein
MRPEWAEVCEANSKRAASNVSTVTVLNAAAAVEQGSGSFTTMGDRSSMAPAGAEVKPGEERVEIPFVTLQSVWEKHIAPRKVKYALPLSLATPALARDACPRSRRLRS